MAICVVAVIWYHQSSYISGQCFYGHYYSCMLFVCCRCWYRQRVRQSSNRLRQEPVPQATALLVRHPRVRPVRSHGSLLSHDGFPHPLCLLNATLRPAADSARNRTEKIKHGSCGVSAKTRRCVASVYS